MKTDTNIRKEMIFLLRCATDMLEKTTQRDDSACSRIVDALTILKNLNPNDHLPGIDGISNTGSQVTFSSQSKVKEDEQRKEEQHAALMVRARLDERRERREREREEAIAHGEKMSLELAANRQPES